MAPHGVYETSYTGEYYASVDIKLYGTSTITINNCVLLHLMAPHKLLSFIMCFDGTSSGENQTL